MRATGDRDRRPSPYPRPDNAPRRAPVVRNKSARRRYLGAASAVVVAGVVTFGFLGGGSAAIAEGGENEVVFTGECGLIGVGLGNKSTPSTDQLTITEGEKVTFTNKLKNDAVLHIGGTESDVDKGESKTVKLTANTEAKMSPKCSLVLKDHSEKTTVKVTPKQETGGGGDSDDGDNGTGGSTGDNAGGGSDSGDNGTTAGGADKPGDSPDTGKKPKAEGKAGDPNKGDDAKDSAEDEAAAADGGSDDSSGTKDTTEVADANKVSTESSASALLAALAALCLAGVGFAALRTWISSRNTASA